MNVIVTGATGMVGEGVLHECLNHPQVDRVLSVSRKPYGLRHPKLKEVIHDDFFNFSRIESHLSGYEACFFCLGVTSVGKNEEDYRHYTYELTMHVASTLAKLNRDMTFIYISGAGTDDTEKGRMMWARVKGKTENDLRKLPFKKSFAFRPGFIAPTKGLRNTLKLYRYLGWVVPVVKAVAPGSIVSLKEIGLAMIHAAQKGYPKDVLEIKDIKTLAKESS
jgi:uncharacterized protein YbjT (DUF2867 family)